MLILEGIAPLIDAYDGFILDLWGVVHDGRRPYPGVPEALARLRAAGKRIVCLTNAPRRAWVIAQMLERMGLDPAMVDGIISSGELTWRHLQRRDHPWFARIDADRPLRAFHIGPERDRSVIEDGVAEAVADPAAADLLLNTGPDPERGSQDAEAYRPALLAAAAHRLPMVCVNPDRAVMVGGERLICAGALADIYLELGGAVLEIGKPDRAVYPPVMELLGLTDRRRLLAIGDTPHTDLAGAEAAGIDSLWALTGLTADAHGPDPAPALLDRVAAAEHVHPIAALRSLRW